MKNRILFSICALSILLPTCIVAVRPTTNSVFQKIKQGETRFCATEVALIPSAIEAAISVVSDYNWDLAKRATGLLAKYIRHYSVGARGFPNFGFEESHFRFLEKSLVANLWKYHPKKRCISGLPLSYFINSATNGTRRAPSFCCVETDVRSPNKAVLFERDTGNRTVLIQRDFRPKSVLMGGKLVEDSYAINVMYSKESNFIIIRSKQLHKETDFYGATTESNRFYTELFDCKTGACLWSGHDSHDFPKAFFVVTEHGQEAAVVQRGASEATERMWITPLTNSFEEAYYFLTRDKEALWCFYQRAQAPTTHAPENLEQDDDDISTIDAWSHSNNSDNEGENDDVLLDDLLEELRVD